MDSKPWYHSRTILFFLLFAAANVAGLFGFADWTPTSDQSELINLAVAGIAMALRWRTTQPITIGG